METEARMKNTTDSLSSHLLNISYSGRSLRIFATLLTFLLAAFPCFGDGKIIARKAMGKVEIPDQRAFISYQDGIEHLAIETDFHGEGDEFAWIIPTPSTPEVKEVTNGFFPTLRFLLQPEMRHRLPTSYSTLLTMLSIFTLLGLLFAFIHRVEPLAAKRWIIYIFSVFAVMLTGFLRPTLMSSRGSRSIPSAISVHKKERVGSYEVMSLSSDDAQDLVTWLKQNGYQVAEESAKVIEEYVQNGWVFTTIKLLQASNGEKTYTPHPLAFVFETDEPVYPLKLTGVDNSQCHIELYVFGPDRAEAAGFKVLRCTSPKYPDIIQGEYHNKYRSRLFDRLSALHHDPLRIAHKGLRSAIGDAPVLTKLARTFAPGEMTQDAYITWHPFLEQKEIYYSYQYAKRWVVTCCLIVWISLILLLLFILWLNKKQYLFKNIALPNRKHLFATSIFTAFILLATAGFSIYLSLPKRDVNVVSIRRSGFIDVTDLSDIILYQNSTILTPDDKLSTTEIRNRITVFIEKFKGKNSYTGEPIKEEDSPGNYMIMGTEDEPQLVYFDEIGGEVIAWPPKEEE